MGPVCGEMLIRNTIAPAGGKAGDLIPVAEWTHRAKPDGGSARNGERPENPDCLRPAATLPVSAASRRRPA
jgi:hypothetical protein